MCISKYHDRSTSLLKLNQAVFRRNKHLARRSKGENGSSLGSDDDSDDELAFDDKGSSPCELAVKLPLWDMLFDMSALHKQSEALGARGKGLQRLFLAACKPGAAVPQVWAQDRRFTSP